MLNDFFNADPVPTFLVWGPWAWAGMILLLLVVSAVSWLLTAVATERTDSSGTMIAVVLNVTNGLLTHNVMRHLAERWAVYLLAAVAVVIAFWLLAALRGQFWGYVMVFASLAVPVLFDGLARQLSYIPMSWGAFTVIILLGVGLAISKK